MTRLRTLLPCGLLHLVISSCQSPDATLPGDGATAHPAPGEYPSIAPIDPQTVIDHPLFGHIVMNELILEFDMAVPAAEAITIIDEIPATILAFQPETHFYAIHLTAEDVDLAATWQQLRQDSRLFAVVPRRVYRETATSPNDPAWSDSWNEEAPSGSNWPLEFIRAPSAWDIATGSHDVCVAVIEINGFDTEHEDLLADRFLAIDGDISPSTPHGTAVAGIIAARGNNGRGITGVAWSSCLYLFRADTTDSIRTYIRGAISLGADVINLSLGWGWRSGDTWSPGQPTFEDVPGTDDDSYREQLLDEARSWTRFVNGLRGDAVLVQAAGNDGIDARWSLLLNSIPASDAEVQGAAQARQRILTVAGLTASGALFDNCGRERLASNHGVTVDVAAPGVDFFSTIPWDRYGPVGCGTSFAAPLATGVGVLLRARDSNLAAAEVKQAIVAGSRTRTPTRFGGVDYYPLDAYQALLRADEIACRKRAELCNGHDDNCNGEIDEAWPLGQACSVGVGACAREGTWVCAADGLDAVCNADPGTPAIAEICINGEDDDCDGEADENCECDPIREASTSCGTDVGRCEFGQQDCRADGTWGPCEGGVGPADEVCDGENNDCDGETDENWLPGAGGGLGTPCTAGVGACERPGTTVCAADGLGTECIAVPGEGTPETCNGEDDDCNALVDDGDLCTDPPGAACEDATTLRTYEPSGVCSEGSCEYTSSTVLCEFGCNIDACNGDPCEGVVCDDPPPDECSDAVTLLTHADIGACAGVLCEYDGTEVSCAFGCELDACRSDPCPGTCGDATCSCGEDNVSCPDDCVCPGGMVLIPAGPSWMGCAPGDDYCDDDENPYHEVVLGAYCIDLTEVTVAAWEACVESGGCPAPDTAYLCNWTESGAPSARLLHPVNCVSWSEAETFCAWLGKRLPTEAEWEKAARGTDGRVFPWGDAFPGTSGLADCVTANYGGVPGVGFCSGGGTSPTCTYSPSGDSPFGLCDMAGNILEWVADWYGSGYYATSPLENPRGPASGVWRALRGGSWTSNVLELRASSRRAIAPRVRIDYVGFRCAL